MSNTLQLKIYHLLPSSLRSVAASAWGLYLRNRRYGPETERLVDEAQEREQWNSEQWTKWQQEQLDIVLHRAATQVPYYREYWTARRRLGGRTSWRYLENWPILEKEAVRQNPRAFVADDCDVRLMYHEHTSGTTGKPLNLWWSLETVRRWYALSEVRCRQWHSVGRHDRYAILGGQLVTSVHQRRPPFWVWNKPCNQLYMSSYHLMADSIPHYLDALLRYRVSYLWGYTSSLYALARETKRLGRGDLRMRVAVTNAEPVLDYQRKAISEAFHCPVRETYGMAEIVAGASECESGRLHVWPEVGWVEVLEANEPVAMGRSGDLICTGLLNADMPLIRYRVGDRGVLYNTDSSCSCGRKLPHELSVEGRADDVLFTKDGRRIGRLDTVFKADLPIQEAQIVQETLSLIRVRVVPAPGFSPRTERILVERLRARMGPVDVIVDEVQTIQRGTNGKFRAVVCSLSKEDKTTAVMSSAGRA